VNRLRSPKRRVGAILIKMSWRLFFAVERALALGLALAVSIHAVNAKEIVLTCIVFSSDGAQHMTEDLTIDLDNRWLAFDKGDNNTASLWFDIIKVSKFAITAILQAPHIDSGTEVLVLNRDSGQYIRSHVSLSCTDANCRYL
jgi:hypothetical protein